MQSLSSLSSLGRLTRLGTGGGFYDEDLMMPIANNSRIIIDGDSHAGQGNVYDAGNGAGTNEMRPSMFNMALLFAGTPGYVPFKGNVGVPGESLGPSNAAYSTILKRIAATNTLGGAAPWMVLVSALGNDIAGGASTATCLARLDEYIAASLATYIVWPTVPIRFGANVFSGPQEIIRQAVNAGIMARRGKKFRPVNIEPAFNNVGQTFDNVHENNLGASAMGALIGREISRLIEGWGSDRFTNVAGNFMLAFTGSGGTVNSAAGVISTGYVLYGGDKDTATVTGSIDSDGKPVITVDGSYNGDYKGFSVYRQAAYAGGSAGDELESFIDFQIINPTLNIKRFSAGSDLTDGGWPPTANGTSSSDANAGADFAVGPGRYCAAVPFKSRGAITNATHYFQCAFATVGVSSPVRGKIKIHAMGVRNKTINP